MAYDYQIEYEIGPLLFYADVMFVNAQNPAVDQEIPAPFTYDVFAYSLKPGPAETDPPQLEKELDHRFGLKDGQGCVLTLPCGDYFWLVFAKKLVTSPEDPWDNITKTCMYGTANVQPWTWADGYLVFHLKTA